VIANIQAAPSQHWESDDAICDGESTAPAYGEVRIAPLHGARQECFVLMDAGFPNFASGEALGRSTLAEARAMPDFS
jgi:hypothetical protein